MNRTFSAIALQSAIAAAIIAAAPLVSAEQWTEPQMPAFTGSTASRAEVRAETAEAVRLGKIKRTEGSAS